MNLTDVAYLAGVIDSDGSISVGISGWRTKHRGERPAYVPFICIAQCEPAAVNLAKALFGGSISIRKAPIAALPRRFRPMQHWIISNKQVDPALEALLPFLRIKKKQAEIIMEIRKLRINSPRATSPELVSVMHKLTTEVRLLNSSKYVLTQLTPEEINRVPLSNTKLTTEQVRQIRADTRTHRAIADAFSISHGVVTKIKNRDVWKWVE